MDKGWMQAPRSTTKYAEGVLKFLEFAFTNSAKQNKIMCPCKNCVNTYWLGLLEVHEHLICDGFMAGYTTWIHHGDQRLQPIEPVADSNAHIDDLADSDEIERMLMEGFGMYNTASLGAEEELEDDIDHDEEYRKLVADGGQDLYPGCKSYSKLQFIVRLLNIKNLSAVSDVSFDRILWLFKDALPEGQSLPKNLHEAKKFEGKLQQRILSQGNDDESDAIRYEESDDETDASQGYHNEEDDGHVNSQSQGNENGVRGSEAHEPKKKGGRGPTHLTRFWEEHDVNNKVNLKFNRFGQPCGFKTCKLTNVIGYFVKGKTISMAYPNWTKVPKASKEKLWGSLKQFFNIDEPYKLWVLKSASKKWKDFKVVLKRKFFKANMSTRRNIANGCEDRIPIEQWEWLVKHWKTDRAKAKSEQLKENRASQENGKHTAGSRSFAYVLDQKELKEGRQVGRAELYRITHTKKDGTPVDTYSGAKIVKITKALEEDPTLIGEEACDGDLYSTMFPEAKKGRYGLGLLAGGGASKALAEALARLEESRQENKELRVVVDKLIQTQTSMMAQNDRPEQQYIELKTMLLSRKESPPSETIPEQDPTIKDNSKDWGDTNDQEHSTSLPSRNKRKENNSQVAMESTKRVNRVNAYIEKVKSANKSNLQHESVVQKSMKVVDHNMSRKFQTPTNKDGLEGIMKRGMEVSLKSPNSAKIVALGTIQGTDPNAEAMDGRPLADSVEVVVDYIFNQKTMLPRAHGKLKMLGNAQARCIAWPRVNVARKDGTPLHSKVMVNEDGIPLRQKVPLSIKEKFINKENVDPKSTPSQAEVHMVEKKLKKSSSGKAIATSGQTLSQTGRAPLGKDRPLRHLGHTSSQSPYAKVYDNNVYLTTSRLQQTAKAKQGLGSQTVLESQGNCA